MKDMLFLLQSAAGHCVIRIYRETAPNSIISRDSIDLVATGRQSELFFTLSDFVLFLFFFNFESFKWQEKRIQFFIWFLLCVCRHNLFLSSKRNSFAISCVSGNPWNSRLLLHGPTERWDNVDYWDFPRHVRPLAFLPCSLFVHMENTGGYCFKLFLFRRLSARCWGIESTTRSFDYYSLTPPHRDDSTLFFFAWRIPFMFVCVGILGFGYCGRCCWKVSCQVAYSFQRHLTW